MTRILLAILIAFGISGCGGGGGGSSGNFSGSHGIGPRPPLQSAPDATADHGEVSVSYGQTQDPSALGAPYLVSYLRADADDDYENSDRAHTGRIQKFDAPPTVRVAAGTPPELITEVANVVRDINAALPNSWQLAFSTTPAPAQPDHAIEPPVGEIHVQFSSRRHWQVHQDRAGFAQTFFQCIGFTCQQFVTKSGRTYVDPSITTGRIRERIIAHELLHNLGRKHVNPARFSDTIMKPRQSASDSNKPILDPLDREALLAVYGRLGSGTPSDEIEDDLGPWAIEAMQIHGELAIAGGNIVFGASTRNSRTQPWVTGPAAGYRHRRQRPACRQRDIHRSPSRLCERR